MHNEILSNIVIQSSNAIRTLTAGLVLYNSNQQGNLCTISTVTPKTTLQDIMPIPNINPILQLCMYQLVQHYQSIQLAKIHIKS